MFRAILEEGVTLSDVLTWNSEKLAKGPQAAGHNMSYRDQKFKTNCKSVFCYKNNMYFKFYS